MAINLGAIAAKIALMSLFNALSNKFAPDPPTPVRVPGSRSSRGFEPLIQPNPTFFQGLLEGASQGAGMLTQHSLNKQLAGTRFDDNLALIRAATVAKLNATRSTQGLAPAQDTLGQQINAEVAADVAPVNAFDQRSRITQETKEFLQGQFGGGTSPARPRPAKQEKPDISPIDTKLLTQLNKNIDRESKFITKERERILKKFDDQRSSAKFIKNVKQKIERFKQIDKAQERALSGQKLLSSGKKLASLMAEIEAIFAKHGIQFNTGNDPLGGR